MADLLADITRQIASAPSSDQHAGKSLLPPQMASKYERIKVVGRGSFGEAVLIRGLANGMQFISKEVNMSSMSARDRQDAMNEVRFLSNLSHPNIIQYVESCQHNSILYIVMEYADNGDLWDLIQSRYRQGRRLDETEILSIFTQICMALKYMHDRKMLHRDLKTGNVFLTSEGLAKLGDFGISTIISNTLAVANTVCGTPNYFSPELCQGKPYNNKADMWALGCILHEMMSGKLAFEGSTLQELYTKIVNCELRPLPDLYSQELRALCHRILSQQQAMRPTATALLRSYIIVGFLKDLQGPLRDKLAPGTPKTGQVSAPTSTAVPTSPQTPQSKPVAEQTSTPMRSSAAPMSSKHTKSSDLDLDAEMEDILQQLEGEEKAKPPKKLEVPAKGGGNPDASGFRKNHLNHHSMQVERLLEELETTSYESDAIFGDAHPAPAMEALSRSMSNLQHTGNDSIANLIEEEIRRLR